MIGWLCGNLIDKDQPGKLVIDVSGVGYDVETSLQTFFQVEHQGNPVSLYIHTVVREDAFLLYGFYDKLERSLFRALIKVNGVGPKLAMTILSNCSKEELIQLISQKQVAQLTKFPGIGKKTAERLIIEMQDSIEHLSVPMKLDAQVPFKASVLDEATFALEALGYKLQEARKVVAKIDDGNKTCEQLIRQALQILSPKVY